MPFVKCSNPECGKDVHVTLRKCPFCGTPKDEDSPTYEIGNNTTASTKEIRNNTTEQLGRARFVKCTNPQCGKDVHVNLSRCPFCGTPKDEPSLAYEISNKSSLNERRMGLKSRLTITTTNQIENYSIVKYLDIITINMVIGTNFFVDMLASFNDFFGGFSGAYKEQLDCVYIEALDQLKDKAVDICADAVVGLKVDYSEISGKDKSMFMVSLTGTPVKIKQYPNYRKYKLLQELKSFLRDGIISQEEYDIEISKLNN